jgi:SHAQKYF class myb-like DNA-binding protein
MPKTKSKSKKSKAKATVTMATADKATSSDKTGANGENTGRWTAEEHRLFLQGLEQHGKGWKKIASLIKSRTVVQIRTHAQKYFQKLAKARQNGEEGDVAMEGRGGSSSLSNAAPMNGNAANTKRRRQTSGSKRKAISNVVSSAQRDGKLNMGCGGPMTVSPALAPYVVQPSPPTSGSYGVHVGGMNGHGQPDVMTAALEDSLYRFLTPNSADCVQLIPQNGQHKPEATPIAVAPAPTPDVQTATTAPINVPTQAQLQYQPHPSTSCSNPSIILPTDPNSVPEGSPTGVADISFPTFAPPKEHEPPQWYNRASDVDDLLNDADALDWLTDTGDLNETYKPDLMSVPLTPEDPSLCSTSESEPDDAAPTGNGCHPTVSVGAMAADNMGVLNANSVVAGLDALPPVVSSASMAMDTLPSLFESSGDLPNKRLKVSASGLFSTVTDGADANLPTGTPSMDDEGFSVFDSNFDEQAFVTALLESNENAAALSVLS